MFVERIEVGFMGVNCILVGCEETKEALIIDPGEDADWILDEVRKGNWKVRYIVNTHAHSDHIGANKAVKEKTGAEILIHSEDAPMLTSFKKNLSFLFAKQFASPPADKLLKDGDLIKVGKTVCLKVLHTPGHTPGSISLYQDGYLFSGDTLFSNSIGRTDFPGGSFDQIMNSIKNKLMVLPDDTKVYPGHNALSTIGEIETYNPFVK